MHVAGSRRNQPCIFLKIDPRVSVLADPEVFSFPVDFAGRPYNTLTLPCKRVYIRQRHRETEVTMA